VEDTTAPIVDHLPGELDRTVECSDPAALAAALALEPAFTDNCDPALTIQSGVQCLNAGYGRVMRPVRLHHNKKVDGIYRCLRQVMECGQFGYHHNDEYQQVITVEDTTPPAFTVPEDITICTDLECSYNASPDITGHITDLADNCTPITDLIISYVDDLSNLKDCNEYGYIIRSWSLTDVCGNKTIQDQIITVEPVPRFTALPEEKTICNLAGTVIEIQTETIASRGMSSIKFVYTSEVTRGNVTGLTSGILSPGGDGKAILEIAQLINNTVEYAEVTYTITAYIDDVNENLFCQGEEKQIKIVIEPTLVIEAEGETICNESTTEIFITSISKVSSPLGVHYTWEVVDNNDENQITGYEDNEAGVSISAPISQTLTNNTPVARYITYRITPWALDRDDNLFCPGGHIDIIVWVEPTPEVIVTPLQQTICNMGQTDILLETPTEMTEGIVTFDYIATATGGPGAVTGFTAMAQILGHGHVISDQITNNTNEVQYVTYLITPGSMGTGCAEGKTVEVEIAVNPTPQLSAAAGETIVCDSTTISIEVNDLLGNVHGSKVYELITSDAGGNVEGVQPSGEYEGGTDIINQLINLTGEVQEVTYNIRARIRDAAGTGTGYCDNGTNITINIFVNPTPEIHVVIADTVYCDNSEITFNIQDLNGTVAGDKIYTLTTSFENGQVTGVQPDGEYERTGFSNTLQNLSNQVQIIYYQFRAHIKDQRGPGTGYCSQGGDYTFAIYLNPTPVVNSSLFNDRDTICTNTSMVFQLNSPTSVFDGVITFDYLATASGNTGDLTGFLSTENDLPNGIIINRNLVNHTSIPQYLTYSVTPKALGTGCAAGIIADIVIRVNPSPIDSFYISKEIECFGSYSGSLALVTASGSGPYNILWTGPDGFSSSESILDDIRFGRYNLTVKDSNNCVAEGSIRLSNPDPIAVNFAADQISCFGGSDGRIRITTVLEGAGPPYSFHWTGPDDFVFGDNTTQIQNNLIAGQYKVVITDGKGCKYSSTQYDPLNTLLLSEPDPLSAHIEITDASCGINQDGTARGIVIGGTAPYSYMWQGPEGFVFENNTTQEVENLPGGIYTMQVTDSKGCVAVSQAEVGTLAPFTVTPVLVTDYNGFGVSCFGASDATVELEILGDYPPFNFQWSNGSTTRNIENISAGEYYVYVVDAANCPSEATIIIEQPEELKIDYIVEDVSCFGFADGRVIISAQGGSGHFQYNWQNGQSSADVSGMEAGGHFIKITDRNNCSIDTIIQINEPSPLITNPLIEEPYCEETTDGSIELNLSGGTFPYSFSWSGGQTSEDIYGIRKGTYYVTVEDFNNCVRIDTIMVNSINDLCIRIPNAFTPNDDGFNDYWVIGSKVAGTLGELYPWAVVEVYNRLGELVYRSREGYPQPWDGTSRGHKLPMDSYFYVIFRNNGQPPVSGHVTIIR
jgi:gliding motility-associated-like protein